MSKGFVKEEDQEEAPIIPPRAALPPGETNYVTEHGFQLLLNEKEELESSRPSEDELNETERRRTNMLIDGKLRLLSERIVSARIIDLENQPHDEVRFGATVKYLLNGKEFSITIVGVDEADIKKGKAAFVAPLVKAMYGKRVGDDADFELGDRKLKLKIKSLSYTH